MPLPKTFTGARAIIRLNGDLFAFATDVSYTIETEFKEVQEIDNSLPAELAPGRIRVHVVATNLRVPGGSPAAARLQPTTQNQMTQPYCSLELRDRITNQVMLMVDRAMLTTRSGKVTARSIGTETWSFVGIGYRDERDPANIRAV